MRPLELEQFDPRVIFGEAARGGFEAVVAGELDAGPLKGVGDLLEALAGDLLNGG
jgi:hypothetical protein